MIEELAAVVRVDLVHGKGQAAQDALEGIGHHGVAAPQHGHSLTPAGGHGNELQGMHVVARGAVAAVMHQVRSKVAGLAFIPRNPPHWDALGQGAGVTPLARQTTRIGLANPSGHPPHRRHADVRQVLFQVRRQAQLTVCCQTTCHGHQTRLQTFCRDVVQTLGNDAQGIVDLNAVFPAALFPPGPASHIASHTPDQRLAVQARHLLHLVQQLTPHCLAAPHIAFLHQLQILESHLDGHSLCGHSSSVTLSFDRTIPLSVTFQMKEHAMLRISCVSAIISIEGQENHSRH
jgi:hypothetical protein